jgi:hypothetical protein
MTWHVRSGGTWRNILDPQVKVSGTWRPVQEAWVRSGGTWRRYYIRFTGATVDYTSGSGTETVPSGATSVTITVIGAGGSGAVNGSPGPPGSGGGGAGTAVKTLSVSGGQTFTYNASANPKTVVNGTAPATNMSANNGTNGSGGGAGGTASGGDNNYTGQSGRRQAALLAAAARWAVQSHWLATSRPQQALTVIRTAAVALATRWAAVPDQALAVSSDSCTRKERSWN